MRSISTSPIILNVAKQRGSEEYRKLPSVDDLLRHERGQEMLSLYPRTVVVEAIRQALESARQAIRRGGSAPAAGDILQDARRIAEARGAMSLRRAINATGIILHTGLGRAVLSERAREAVAEVARGHSTLEIDEHGRRGSRQEHVAGLLAKLTGAEAALVVNNNAAGVFLAVNTLAGGQEVIVSRGQLVEIGGSFRLPDIIQRAGGRLVEVGTTNRTRISDYEKAVTANAGLILRCHPSNFRISGFTEEASLPQLVALAHESFIPLLDDLGSGALVDVERFGLDNQPTVQESVKAGADVICFSGDKLLGGPQAGILVGRAEYIDQCRANPIARALRVDKLTLAALDATLRVYRDGDPFADIPALRAIARPIGEIDSQARRVARAINALKVPGFAASVVPVASETGGGSLPGQSLESRAVAIKSDTLSAEDMGERCRGNDPPIYGRIARDVFLLDMRTVDPKETTEILGCIGGLVCD